MQTPTPTKSGPGGDRPTASGGPPWGLATLIVAVGLVIFLGATRWFLAQPASEPALATPAPAAAATIALGPTSAPARTAAPVAATPAPVPTVTLRPVETATLQPVRTAAPAATVAPAAVPTLTEEWWSRTANQVDPAQAQPVLAALDRYWAVLTPAWRNLDTSHLDDVLTEPRLSQESQIFADQRAQGKGINVAVERRNQQVRDVRLDEAVVYEEYLNHSTNVDLTTGASSGESTPKQQAAAYLFRRSASRDWKVAEVATYDTPKAH
jgi:hypothetical protein